MAPYLVDVAINALFLDGYTRPYATRVVARQIATLQALLTYE